MKVYMVRFRHEIVGVFKDIVKAGECAESETRNAKPDDENIWGRGAEIIVQDVKTDLA
jgi:hypothetical protein